MNNRTLIIGLGGVGSRIVTKMADMVTDENKKKMVQFLIVDTAKDDIDARKDENKNTPGVKINEINTSYGGRVKDIKLSVKCSTHNAKFKFPESKNLDLHLVETGAGQNRCISYLALINTLKLAENFKPLINAIDEIKKQRGTNTIFNVYIVSSLTGGTGSGIVLPLALYLKKELAQIKGLSGNFINGFFILPGVTTKGNTDITEVDTLKYNAYAAIKEINAFLIEAQKNKSHDKNENIKIYLPKLGNIDALESYDSECPPFDICYMYDSENIDGETLDLYDDYIEHAVKCIYHRAIGPLNNDLNMYEGNRKLSDIINPYTGIGSSELCYPADETIRYVSLCWTQKAFEKDWQQFDETYRTMLKTTEAHLLDRANLYISSVQNSKGSFADEIKRITSRWVDGKKEADKFVDYVNVLCEEAKNSATNDAKSNLTIKGRNTEKENVQSLLELKEKTKINVANVTDKMDSMIEYGRHISKNAPKLGEMISNELFKKKVDKKIGNTDIEFHLGDVENNGMYMHPNAIRYFLYKALEELKDRKTTYTKKANEALNIISNENYLSDIPGGIIEDKEKFIKAVRGFFGDDIKKIKDCIDRFDVYFGKTDDYVVYKSGLAVIEKAIERISNLSKCFEIFFDNLSKIKVSVDNEISKIESNVKKNGTDVHYVCTSKEFLEALKDEYKFDQDKSKKLPGNLTESIFKTVQDIAIESETDTTALQKAELQFSNKNMIDSILASFDDLVRNDTTQGAIKLDVDVITAIYNQVHILNPGMSTQNKDTQVKEVILDAFDLAKPYISLVSNPQKIKKLNYCYYNSKHPITDNYDKLLKGMSQHFNYKGVNTDTDATVEKLVFYQSVHWIYAFDLKMFAPKRDDCTLVKDGGDYYRSYANYQGEIGKGKNITPHLKSDWHNAGVMQDIKMDHVDTAIDNVISTVIKGLIYKKIAFFIKNEREKFYETKLFNGTKLETSTPLKRDNEEKCEKLIHVIRSLENNSNVLSDIVNDINTSRGKADQANLNNNEFMKKLKEFDLQEIFPDRAGKTSVFDIAACYRAKPEETDFDEDFSIKIITQTLFVLYAELERISSNIDKDFRNLINDQLNKLIKSSKQYNQKTGIDMKPFVQKAMDSIIAYTKTQIKGYEFKETDDTDDSGV